VRDFETDGGRREGSDHDDAAVAAQRRRSTTAAPARAVPAATDLPVPRPSRSRSRIPSLLVEQGYSLVRSFGFTLIITLAQLPGYAMAPSTARACAVAAQRRRSTTAAPARAVPAATDLPVPRRYDEAERVVRDFETDGGRREGSDHDDAAAVEAARDEAEIRSAERPAAAIDSARVEVISAARFQEAHGLRQPESDYQGVEGRHRPESQGPAPAGVRGRDHEVAMSVTALIILRFLVGLGLGSELPVASTLVSEFAPRRIRGRVVVWSPGRRPAASG
jgi:hypothetical protein